MGFKRIFSRFFRFANGNHLYESCKKKKLISKTDNVELLEWKVWVTFLTDSSLVPSTKVISANFSLRKKSVFGKELHAHSL